MAFLTVAGVTVQVDADGASEQDPESGGGFYRTWGGAGRSTERWRKRSWQFTSTEISEAAYQTLRAAIAAPGIVSCTGDALNGATLDCYVRCTAAPYVRQRDGTAKRTATLYLREV